MSWLDSLEEIRNKDWSNAPESERLAKAREVVNISAYAAAAVALVPVPFADLVLLIPVHTAMVMTVGHVFGRSLSGAEAKRVALELGAVAGVTFAGGAAISAVRKLLLPAIGGVFSVSANFALTWGLGRVATEYFRNPNLSQEDLKKVFDDAVKEGKSAFSKEAFDRFRQKNGDVTVEVEEASDEGGSAEAKSEDRSAKASEAPKSEGAKSHPGGEPPPTSTPSARPKKRTL